MNDKNKIINNLASKIVNRGLAVPSIFFLESTKYITFLGSQFLVFLGPIATCFVNNNKYYNIVEILEDRNNIELLITEIENKHKVCNE